MSTTIQIATSQSSSPSPSATDQSNGGGGSSMQRGANYFFGFLITFVALLLIFVGCGIGSRRRFARRRALMMGDLDSWGDGLRRNVPQVEPTFWEPQFIKGGEKWNDIVPLSTSVIRRKNDILRDSPVSAPPSIMSAIPRHPFRAFPLPSWIPGVHPLVVEPHHTKEPTPEPPEAMQITVMIAMPSAQHKRPPDKIDESALQEYQIGVTRVPWEGGEVQR